MNRIDTRNVRGDDASARVYAAAVHGLATTLVAAESTLRLLESRADGMSPQQRELIDTAIAWIADAQLQILRGTYDRFAPRPTTEPVGQFIRALRERTFRMAEQLNLTRPSHVSVMWVRGPRAHAQLSLDVDLHTMELVLYELLSNVASYVAIDGSAPVRISATVDGGILRLAVEDDGPGIEPEEQPLIFDDGFRGRRARALRPKGVGRGLSMAQRLVLLSGGTLDLVDSPTGARFEICLPLKGVHA